MFGLEKRKSLRGDASRFASVMHVLIQWATRSGSEVGEDPFGKGKSSECQPREHDRNGVIVVDESRYQS